MTTASAVREGDLPRVPTASNVHQKREETEEEEKVAGDVIMDSPSLCNNKKKIYQKIKNINTTLPPTKYAPSQHLTASDPTESSRLLALSSWTSQPATSPTLTARPLPTSIPPGVRHTGHAVQAAGRIHFGRLDGVPSQPIPAMLAADVRLHADSLTGSAWCPVPLAPGHTSLRFHEDPDFCMASPDPVIYTAPTTQHVPVMHFHSAQLAMARRHGVEPPIAEGPSQYDMPLPTSWDDIHKCSKASWNRAIEYVASTCAELLRVEEGLPADRQPHRFRPERVEGKGEAVEYGLDDITAPFGAVSWRDVNGKPVMVTPELAGIESELDTDAMYAAAVKYNLNDMENASEGALYGTTGDFTASATTQLIPAYSGAYEHLDVLIEERKKKLTDFKMPRLQRSQRRPGGFPCRTHPTAILLQLKAQGKVKKRPIKDAGAIRCQRQLYVRRRRRRRWRTLTRFRADAKEAASLRRDGVITAEGKWEDLGVESLLCKKGASGPDSVNATVRLDRQVSCKFGEMREFAKAVDILRSSGLHVDIYIDDFSSYYEMFDLNILERWALFQLVSSFGMEGDPRGSFGLQWLPNKLNRHNFNVCDVIHARLMQAQAEFSWTPYSADTRSKAETFSATRRVFGHTGQWHYQMPWFDDNAAATFAHFGATLKRIRYETWGEFNLDWATAKAAVNLYNATSWTPVVGYDVRAAARELGLPAEKQAKYIAHIDDVIGATDQHQRRLVPLKSWDQLMGRLAHAADILPRMWGDYMLLVSLTADQGFLRWTLIHDQTADVLRSIRAVLSTGDGTPLTPYTIRPGADGRRVWTSHSDASRRDVSFFGAGGGWFRLWHSDVIFFFCHQWPTETVRDANIGELEMAAANIAANLQHDVQLHHYGPELHYLLQYGDNSGVFDHILNAMRARGHGMRLLTQQRRCDELRAQRLLSAKHILREFNKAADALANMDIPKFILEIRQIVPAAKLCRLTVPDAYSDLEELTLWNARVLRSNARRRQPPSRADPTASASRRKRAATS